MRLGVFADAAWANRHDGSSQGGRVVVSAPVAFWKGDRCKFGILSWKSSKCPRICRSSLACETQSSCGAIDELGFCQALWREIFGEYEVGLD